MIIYSRYYNNIDHTWYDSSNLRYSEWDESATSPILKLVFNNGRAYTYENVDINDYLMFKADTISNGKAVNKYIIKKYTGTRVDDVQLESLEQLKSDLQKFDLKMLETLSELNINVEVHATEWIVKTNNIVLLKFNIEENPTIVKTLSSLGVLNDNNIQVENDTPTNQ